MTPIFFSGAVYHVLNRGNYRHDVFAVDGSKEVFEETLFRACERSGWILHAYCLLDNHYHLALETSDANLSVGMQWLQSTFANRFNRSVKERGHVFQGRYKSLVVERDAYFGPLLNYVHLKRKFGKNFSASLMSVVSGYQHSTNANVIYLMATSGLWLKFDNGKFDISSNLYIQNGKAQTGKEVMAYMATIHPGIKFGKVRIGLGGDYVSGDNANNDDYGEKERTFNQMYGAVFKFYGFMNYYSYMKASTANGGLIDIYPNIKVPFGGKHSIAAFYHKFYLANPVLINAKVIDDTDLGSEVDLMYTYKILKDLVLQAGFSYYFTTNTVEQVKKVSNTSIRSPYWGWVMITFTPELFHSK